MPGSSPDDFHAKPGAGSGIGLLLAYAGMALLLAGAVGRLVTGMMNLVPKLAKQPETSSTLADIYPTIPLWWVPESWLGAAVAVALVVLGLRMIARGKRGTPAVHSDARPQVRGPAGRPRGSP